MNDAERKFFEAAQPPATSWFWIGVKFGLGFFTAAFLFGCISVFVWVVFLASLLVGGAAHQTTKASPPAAVAPAAPVPASLPTTPTLALATPAPALASTEEPAHDESPETPPAPPTDFPMGESAIPSAASTDAPKEAPPAPTTPTPARTGNGKIVQIPDDKRRAIIEMHNQQNAQRRAAGLPPLPMQAAPLPRGARR